MAIRLAASDDAQALQGISQQVVTKGWGPMMHEGVSNGASPYLLARLE